MTKEKIQMSDQKIMNEEDLERVLNIYGADISKMPEPLAIQVQSFIDQSSFALSEKYQSAKILDQLLDTNFQSVDVDWDLKSIEDKIMSNISNGQMNNENSEGQVISFSESRAVKNKNNKVNFKSKEHQVENSFFNFRASALIAASLLFGLIIGSFGGADILFNENNTYILASNSTTYDFLYLGTEYSLDSAEFLKN